jgi:hypothetical protein
MDKTMEKLGVLNGEGMLPWPQLALINVRE